MSHDIMRKEMLHNLKLKMSSNLGIQIQMLERLPTVLRIAKQEIRRDKLVQCTLFDVRFMCDHGQIIIKGKRGGK